MPTQGSRHEPDRSSERNEILMNETPLQPASPWPHRLAVLLACATFPLMWVGGLVTSYERGNGGARLADHLRL